MVRLGRAFLRLAVSPRLRVVSLLPYAFPIPQSEIRNPNSPLYPLALDKTSSMCLLETPLWSHLRPL